MPRLTRRDDSLATGGVRVLGVEDGEPLVREVLDGVRAPQRSRDDGVARAWRVALKRSSPAAARLHCWSRPDGVVELAGVCRHDEPPVL